MRNAVRSARAALLAISLLAVPQVARAQGDPVDDLLQAATNAFNDLRYARADSLAKLVMGMNLRPPQRLRAQLIIAASAYPDDQTYQNRALALATLKQVVRTNADVTIPPELGHAGLDSLLAEAKRTTFSIEVTAEQQQHAVGPEGTARVRLRANKRGFFRLTIMAATGGTVAVVDSLASQEGEIVFRTMRNERPIFTAGRYSMIVTGYEPGTRGDTATVQYSVQVDAPALTFVTPPAGFDSSTLLRERTGRYGLRAVVPAVLTAGMAYALASNVRGEGAMEAAIEPDSKGVAVGGAIALTALVAGFADRGRVIPENVDANQAARAAFQKSIADAEAENRRRISEYRTTLTFQLEPR